MRMRRSIISLSLVTCVFSFSPVFQQVKFLHEASSLTTPTKTKTTSLFAVTTLEERKTSVVAKDYEEKEEAKPEMNWKSVASNVFKDDDRPIILFDGLCNLCNGGVNFAIDHDSQAHFRFVSLQSTVGHSLMMQSGRDPDDLSSIGLVYSNGNSHFESEAVCHILMGLDGPVFQGFGNIGLIVPGVLRDAIYHVVSTNRHIFGDNDRCRIDFDGEYDSRFVSDPLDE